VPRLSRGRETCVVAKLAQSFGSLSSYQQLYAPSESLRDFCYNNESLSRGNQSPTF